MIKKVSFITGFLLIFITFSAFGCRSTTEPPTVPTHGNQGEVVFLITDTAANISTISKIDMTVDKIQVHSQSQGWLTASNSSQTYNLLDLRANNTNKVLLKTNLDAGTYDKVRLAIKNVVVADSKGTQQATMPNNTMDMESVFSVEHNATAAVLLDFVADQSVHTTTEGGYVFAPVVKIETRSNAEVKVSGDNEAQVTGGQILTNNQVGMDVNGNVGVGLKINADAILSVTASGIVIGGPQSSGMATVQGTLKSVDSAYGSFVIVTDTGQQLAFRLSGTAQPNATELSSEVGSRVQVVYDTNTSAASAVQLLPTSEHGTESAETTTVQGTLQSVNSASNTITIFTDGGTPLELRLSSITQPGITELSSEIGSRVQVLYDTNTSIAIAVQTLETSGQGIAIISGIITEVNSATGDVTIQTDSGHELTLKMTNGTNIGGEGLTSALFSMADQIGARVQVEYDVKTNTATTINIQ